MINLINVSKKYKYKKTKIDALNSINVKISNNEIVAVMGTSGSGKTTLLNIIGGILKPSAGEYLFNGQKVYNNEMQLAKFRNNNIGFILQHFALINNRNVFYNISLPLMYKKLSKNEIKQRVMDISKILGIFDKLEVYPHMLSGGERQRTAIARAAISNPKVILADEPTSSLDENNKQEVIDILKLLNEQGSTIIIATHDQKFTKICNRIITLSKGSIYSENELMK